VFYKLTEEGNKNNKNSQVPCNGVSGLVGWWVRGVSRGEGCVVVSPGEGVNV